MSPRLKLLGIALACAAPVLLASLTWYFGWGTGSAGNYGELIEPRPLDAPPIEALRGKWILLTFDTTSCDTYCERKLYYMRQTRKAQAKEQLRIERLWGVIGNGEPRKELQPLVDGVHVAPAGTWIKKLPGVPTDHIYLVDPLGNLMMRFPRDPDPKRMIKDLQRLLKYSRIG